MPDCFDSLTKVLVDDFRTLSVGRGKTRAERYARIGEELDPTATGEQSESTTSGGIVLITDDKPYNLLHDSLTSVTQPSCSSAEGETDLCRDLDSDWPAHGADILFPIGLLMNRLREQGEIISQIDYLKFSQPVFNNLTLKISTQERPHDAREVAVSGRLVTSHNRKFFVRGYLNDNPITRDTRNNSIPKDLIRGRSGTNIETVEDGREFIFHLGQNSEAADAIRKGPIAFMPATVLDCVTDAGPFLLRECKMERIKHIALMSRVRNFTIPSVEDFTGGIRLRVRFETEAEVGTSKREFTHIPVTTEFLSRSGEVVGGGSVVWGGTKQEHQTTKESTDALAYLDEFRDS